MNQIASQVPQIAFLGWGSLIWEPNFAFDKWHEAWNLDGPSLPLEFSRVSSTRLGALTLVIDRKHGQATTVLYCLSKRKNLDDAIEDLRRREGTALKNIGFIAKQGAAHRARDKESKEAISNWLSEKPGLSAAVWTDLESNFETVRGKQFSIDSAVDYLQGLDVAAKVKAAEYVWRAPSSVKSSLRETLEVEPWFRRS